MEPLVAVQLFKKITESNVKFSIYTRVDDSMTESHLKQKVPYGVSQKVINYLVKSFTYCIAQNKGEATNIKSAI